jgi:hypothetical protein
MTAPRHVYSVPVTLTVTTTLFVLAEDRDGAAEAAAATDLEDHFTFNTTALTLHQEGVMRIEDVKASLAAVSGITQLPATTYAPNEHPDFVGIPTK